MTPMTPTQQDAAVVEVRADHFQYLVKLADWAAGQGFCHIEGMMDPDEWCDERWGEVGPENGDGYSSEALADALSATRAENAPVPASEEVARLREALEPFSKWADWYDDMLAEDDKVAHGRGNLNGAPPSYILVGDLRRARAALDPQKGG